MTNSFLKLLHLLFFAAFFGCGMSGISKVTIDFVFDSESHCIEINKGCTIDKSIIPESSGKEIIGLYYDKEKTISYNYEQIDESLKIYVDYADKSDERYEEMLMRAISDCVEQFGSELDRRYCYGECNGALVFFKIGDVFNFSNQVPVFSAGYSRVLCGYIFDYKCDFSFVVWKNGEFYTLDVDGSFCSFDGEKPADLKNDDRLTIEFIKKMFDKHYKMFALE